MSAPLENESAAEPALSARLAARKQQRQDAATRRGRRRRRLVVLLVLIAVVSPALYSYTTTMLQPSSLPLGVRSVEWLRANHGNWLVDEVEHIYYGWWKAPTKGGPQLKRLPVVGIAQARSPAQARHHAAPWPPPIKPVFPHPLPSEGVWARTGPLVNGRPP